MAPRPPLMWHFIYCSFSLPLPSLSRSLLLSFKLIQITSVSPQEVVGINIQKVVGEDCDGYRRLKEKATLIARTIHYCLYLPVAVIRPTEVKRQEPIHPKKFAGNNIYLINSLCEVTSALASYIFLNEYIYQSLQPLPMQSTISTDVRPHLS